MDSTGERRRIDGFANRIAYGGSIRKKVVTTTAPYFELNAAYQTQLGLLI